LYRNKVIEDYNISKKKEMMEEVKKTIEEQLKEKKNREIEIKSLNKEFDNKLKKSYYNFLKGQEETEKIKKNKIMLYKLELDKQLDDKYLRMSQPFMKDNIKII
jgi:hypothetical protein